MASTNKNPLDSRDKNSKYFHNKASQRFRRNRILGLQDTKGVMCMGDDNMAGLFENYYQQLLLRQTRETWRKLHYIQVG